MDQNQKPPTPTITVWYRLSPAGQRRALLSGKIGQKTQMHIVTPQDAEAWPLAVSLLPDDYIQTGNLAIDLAASYDEEQTVLTVLRDEEARRSTVKLETEERLRRGEEELRAYAEELRGVDMPELFGNGSYISDKTRTALRLIGRYDEAVAWLDARANLEREEKLALERQREERKRVAKIEREAWIESHGSPRLKRLLAEGISCIGVYRDERLALERPGWEWVYPTVDDGATVDVEEPINAPMTALELLDEARALLPEDERQQAQLAYYTVTKRDQYGEPYKARAEHVVVTRFLDKEIMYCSPASCPAEPQGDEG